MESHGAEVLRFASAVADRLVGKVHDCVIQHAITGYEPNHFIEVENVGIRVDCVSRAHCSELEPGDDIVCELLMPCSDDGGCWLVYL